MKTVTTASFLCCCAAFVLAGCETAATEPESTMGDSVRLMIEQQTHNPGASAANSTNLPEGTDPDRSAAAIKAMREGVAKPTETWGTSIVTGAAASSGN